MVKNKSIVSKSGSENYWRLNLIFKSAHYEADSGCAGSGNGGRSASCKK